MIFTQFQRRISQRFKKYHFCLKICNHTPAVNVKSIVLTLFNNVCMFKKLLSYSTIFWTTNFWAEFSCIFSAYKPIDELKLSLQNLREYSAFLCIYRTFVGSNKSLVYDWVRFFLVLFDRNHFRRYYWDINYVLQPVDAVFHLLSWLICNFPHDSTSSGVTKHCTVTSTIEFFQHYSKARQALRPTADVVPKISKRFKNNL